MRFSLASRDRVFFDLFAEAGQNSLRAAKLLQEMIDGWPDSADLAREILLAEQEGDRITHDISQRASSTFVTPIDAEDIYNLAGKVDDVVDHIEETADFMGLYRIEAPMDQALAMAGVLVKACERLSMLLDHLRELKDLDKHWIEIHRLENEGDAALPRSLRLLVRWRNRPDGGNPLEGHLSQARAGDRRNRERRDRHPDHRDEVRLRAVTVRPPPAGAGSGCPLESATLRNVYVHPTGAKREWLFRVLRAARIRGLRTVAIAW